MEYGYAEPKNSEELTITQRKTLEKQGLKDLRAKNYLFQSIVKNILKTITQKSTSKALWTRWKGNIKGTYEFNGHSFKGYKEISNFWR